VTRRGAISVIVLLAWASGLGVLTIRELNPTMASRLTEVSLRVVPITTYYLVERDGRHVGFASIGIDTVPRTLQVTEYIVTEDEAGSRARVTEQSIARLSRGLHLRDFESLRASGTDSARVTGKILDSLLVVDRGGVLDSLQVPVASFPGMLAATVAMLLNDPSPGSETQLASIDPATGEAGTATLRISAESLFVVVDSAVADSSGRWFAVHRDTVRAWRMLSEGAGPPLDAWIDAQGLVVEARRPGGLVLRRTAFEIAFENWRRAAPGRSVSARAGGNIVPATWLASGAPRPDVLLDSLRLQLGSDVPRQIAEWFSGRVRPGSIRTVTRTPASQLVSRYALPMSERLRGTFAANLGPTPLLEVEDPAVARLASRLRGDETDPLEVVRRIATWTRDSIRAEAGPQRTARGAIGARSGDAREFALVFTAVARAAGIPTRLVSGLLHHDGRFYAHAWGYAYIGRWIAVDPMLGQVPADASHLEFAHDVVDLGPDIARVLNRVELTIVGSARSP
jgi:hypothetical protein